MAKRLNPQRRREMRQKEARLGLALALNPTTQAEIGNIRSVASKPLYGPSGDKQIGCVQAAMRDGMVTFAQHQRRSPTKKGESVSKSDVTIPDPSAIRERISSDALPLPLPRKRLSKPNKLVVKAPKRWGGK